MSARPNTITVNRKLLTLVTSKDTKAEAKAVKKRLKKQGYEVVVIKKYNGINGTDYPVYGRIKK